MTFTAVALVLSTMGEATPAYIWNASKSVPIGLYQLQPVGRLAVTELVAVRPPEPLATFLDLNGYLPIGVPMLKRVLALPGQTVCRKGLTISVDGSTWEMRCHATAAAVPCLSGRDVASLRRTSSFS
jgi:type IV secretory pathway protease TraF